MEKKKDKKKEGKTSEKKGKGGKDSDNGNGDANAADNQENNHDGPKSPPVVCVHIIRAVYIFVLMFLRQHFRFMS